MICISHLITNYKTVDGNFHANRYFKNTDQTDTSLWEGFRGYFPGRHVYARYLDSLPVTQEVSYIHLSINHFSHPC